MFGEMMVMLAIESSPRVLAAAQEARNLSKRLEDSDRQLRTQRAEFEKTMREADLLERRFAETIRHDIEKFRRTDPAFAADLERELEIMSDRIRRRDQKR